ncbi:OmpA family protein [Providencia burhodogranariea]|uniref:OmpA-like domain-containing protein n=1 Tax=Providencia burhodogranariea DSM 19968 TaxID=1141662 RepID=K8W9A1_9GAMM|nr:OmpA family protein [Providencia burhodogranariea]EKT57248.1 hypothetical protein OOA_15320 [Providencia burhodogranariea DSM 19968]
MQNPIKQAMTLLAAGLFLWLVWGFWSLGLEISLFLTVVALTATIGLMIWRYKQQQHTLSAEHTMADIVPAPDYQGAVVLVCGQSQALFVEGQAFRETPQGWYIAVRGPADLVNIVQQIVEQAPMQLGQLSILFAILPEQMTQQETLTQEMLSWRRAIDESRQKAGKRLPLWMSLYLTPWDEHVKHTHTEGMDSPWFTLLNHQREFQVVQEGTLAQPLSVWLSTHGLNQQQQFLTTLWFDELLAWLNQVFIPQLTVAQTGAPPLTVTAWAVQFIAISSQPNNLWQQFLQEKTTLPLVNSVASTPLLPVPDILLNRLRHDVNLLRGERLIGVAGLICGLFLIGALIGSYHHNRQLIRHIGEDISRFEQLAYNPLDPKLVAYQQLQTDASQLALWDREGIPAAYSLALYQGNHLLPYLHTLLSSWAPPASPPPVVVIKEAPEMISLDSLALFDVGQYALKANATKVLVDALIHIRAKPGWLIVISGYTDNTGNPESNQILSLKRAESVRDWMISTSDIDPTCFAVQGYGQNHPVADNATPEGRTSNRRVEIRLMPQADACQTSDAKPLSPMEGDTFTTLKEK